MKYAVEQWVTYDADKDCYSYNPWYLASGVLGGKVVSYKIFDSGNVPSYLGIAYERWDINALVMYPKPLHLLVRYGHYFHWRLLRFLYWVGLLDTRANEEFRWADFYRIKVHK